MNKERLCKILDSRGFLLAVALASTNSVLADVLPPDRRIDWSYSGVPGGIPYRTTIYQTFSAGATASQINSALGSCPSNQVVFLNAGSYALSTKLSISRNGVTLRGATNSSGAPTTILNFDSAASGDGLIDIPGMYPANNWAGVPFRDVTSGYTQGSTNMLLASAPTGLQPGYIMVLDEINDEIKIRSNTSTEGSGVWGGRNGNRAYSQFLRVKSISGSTVTFEPPIYGNYWTNSLSPQIYWWGASTIRSGIEDLQVNRNVGGGGVHNLHLALADSCWVRNVKAQQAYNGLIRTAWTLNCEIRDCYLTLHDNVGSATYSLYLTYTGSLLAQNNIGYITPCFLGMMDTMGCIVSYNYATNFPYSSPTWLPECMMQHGGHNYFNLFEGNLMPSLWSDFIHGNASYTTIHRNRYAGWEPGKTGSTRPINMEAYQDYFTCSGNVLGTPGIQTTYAGEYNVDATSLASMIRKGNYNYADNAVPASEALGSDVLLPSYYLSSKPGWFGDRPWPANEPANPAAAVSTNLPAGYRFTFGTLPGAGQVNQAPLAMVGATPAGGVAPLSVTFSSVGSYDPEGASLTYLWVFGDGSTSTAANPSHTYLLASNYLARLTVSDGTNTTSSTNITISVTVAGVNNPPVAIATASPTTGLAPQSVAFSSAGSSDPEGTPLSYNWTFGDGTTSTAANPSHTYQVGGVYTAQLSVSDGTNTVTATPIVLTFLNPGSGLVAAYGFEEGAGTSVTDASGNGNNGAITNAPWVTGKFGKALSFDGVSSVITVNDSASLDLTTGMTLEAWVYPTSFSTDFMNVIYKNGSYGAFGSSPGNHTPGLSFGQVSLYGPSALPLNTWSHLVGTYDGANMLVYVNGVQVSSQAQTGLITPTTGLLMIGGNALVSGKGWAGLIDEVRIYNRALTPGEILTDMNNPVVTPPVKPAAPQNLRVVSQ